MKKYWISWEANPEFGSFTLNSPWWISGYGVDVNPTLCAAIKTHMNPDDFIRLSYDKPPHGIQFRFIEEKPDDWSPFTDRFPKADWMEWDDAPVIKEMGDKTIKVGDTVRMQYPPKYNFGWISIKNKYPENLQRVLAYCQSGEFNFMIMVYYANNIFSEFLSECDRFNSRTLSEYVTHWQPLPEPPYA